jgi:DNA repair protein SbcC/Rad50
VVFAECSGRIVDMQTRRDDLDSAVKALIARDATLRAAWLERLVQAGLPGIEPDALSEWQVRRHNALQIAEQLGIMRADRDKALAESVRACSRVAAALRAVDQPVADDAGGDATALPSLIKQADRWEKLAARAEAEHAEHAKVMQKQRAEREKVGGQIAATEAELTRHVTALQGWHARLFMPADSAPEAVKARLDELDGLARQSSALSDAQLRRAQHQAVVDDLAAQAGQLARLLDEPVPEAVDDFADRLRKRLAVSRQSNQERTALIRDQTRAQEKKRSAEAEQAAQTSVQARLCAAAGTATIDKLAHRVRVWVILGQFRGLAACK